MAGDLEGVADGRAPLVLLHGLTFDRSVWEPALHRLRVSDPGRRVLALDLPGHGASPEQPSYDPEVIADWVAHAVTQVGLAAPVVVGHSAAAAVATMYAARHPARGVVNVDQSLRVARIARLLRSVAEHAAGPHFPALWEAMLTGMGIDLLRADAQQLIRATSHPRQQVVLGYWRWLLDRSDAELERLITDTLAALHDRQLPYHLVLGAPPDPTYMRWLKRVLPRARVTVLSDSGHFPHIAHPDRFAEVLAATGRWPSIGAGLSTPQSR